MHYLVHLPTMMIKFGPMIRSWCMRFEARHKYFKDLAKVIKNFKNLPYSLSLRHQCKQYAQNLGFGGSTQVVPNDDVQLGTAEQVADQAKIKDIQDSLLRFYNIDYSQSRGIYTLKSLTVHGTLYKPGVNTYLLCNVSNNLPEFGRIM